jgi:hypothetical protein
MCWLSIGLARGGGHGRLHGWGHGGLPVSGAYGTPAIDYTPGAPFAQRRGIVL